MAKSKKQILGPMYCEHANEMPVSCPCPPECWCRVKGPCRKRFENMAKQLKKYKFVNPETGAVEEHRSPLRKGVSPAKGILIITIPIGSVPLSKIKDVMEMGMKRLKPAFDKIKAAGWVIFSIPSRTQLDTKIEQIRLD